MKAAIYARVSTSDKQDYTRQVTQLQDICKKHGFKSQDVEVFAESVSGYNKTERHQLDALLSKVESNPKNYTIYVSEISRLGRNPITTRQVIDHLTDIGVPVYIQSLNQFTLENGKRNMIMNIILQVLLEYANLESQTTKERSKQGLKQSALNGKVGGGLYIPYGYKKDQNGMMIIDKEEKRVIQRIFDLYATGTNGIKVISQILNEDGVPTRINKAFINKSIKFKSIEKDSSRVKWSDKTIHDILRNTIYIGKRNFKGEIIEAPQLAFIKLELFEKCNAIMKSKTHTNYMNKHTFLLKDLMKCGVCGKSYCGRYKKHKLSIDKWGKKKDTFENTYVCTSRLAKGRNCKNIGINISLIESALFHQLQIPDYILAFVNNTNTMKAEMEASIIKLEQSLKLDTSALAAKHKEKERLLDVYISGSIPQKVFDERQIKMDKEIFSFKSKIELINKKLKESKRGLIESGSTKMNKKKLESFRDNRTQLQAYFKQCINSIVITKLDNDNVLATINFSIVTELGGYYHQFLLDVKGLRQKPKQYWYKSTWIQKKKPAVKDFDKLEWMQVKDILTVD